MKAVLLKNYGGVDQLSYEDVPIPVAAAGEVLVKLVATSINPIDYKLRGGDMKGLMPLNFPAILGRDLAGEIVALGEGVAGLDVKDLVFGLANQTYAEYVACKAEILGHIPAGLNPVDAGVLPLVLLTGAQLIEKGIAPREGERILITGALGGVGRTAVHVARKRGAYVIAAVRAREREAAGELGADEVLAVDDPNELRVLKEIDAVADTVGHDVIDRLIPYIRKTGVLATVLGKPKSAEGRAFRIAEVWAQPDAKRLEELAQDIASREFSIPIGKRFTLAEIRQAQEIAEKGGVGKVLLTP